MPEKFSAEHAAGQPLQAITEVWNGIQYGYYILEKSGGPKNILTQSYRFKTLEEAFRNAKLWIGAGYDLRILGPEGFNLDSDTIRLELELMKRAA